MTSLASDASVFRAKVNHQHFSIFQETDEITLKTNNLDLSLKRKACNTHILKKLEKDLLILKASNLPTDKGHVTNMNISLTIDNELIKTPLSTGQILFLKNFIEYFKELKIEEQLNCN